jgi:uncharacterized protein
MIKHDLIIQANANKKMLLDFRYDQTNKKKPVVIFSHGFKGFKDWGHFNLIAEEFAKSGFAFLKFNFSHNGTTPEHPKDFADLDAFGNNNFSKELDDLGTVIDFISEEKSLSEDLDTENIFLIGHSLGGAISLLKSIEDARIKKVVTWAAVSDTEKWMNPPNLEEWKTNGVVYTENARTKQQMPLYYQFREDFYTNINRVHLIPNCEKISVPVLILHGTNDFPVPVEEAHQMHARIKNSQLKIIEGADHTFGGKEPWNESSLPEHTMQVIKESIQFLTENSGNKKGRP